MERNQVLQIRGIEKSFGDNPVLRGVSLTLTPGKLTALLGANGAGKSTLIKTLCGLEAMDSGSVERDGRSLTIRNPKDAAEAGIQVVHQRVDDAIVPGLSVAANLCYEALARGEVSPFCSDGTLIARAKETIKTLSLDWDDEFLSRSVDALGIADCQLLLLARALAKSPQVLVLDEPTSTLSASEVDRLFVVIGQLLEQGVAILYVSHRMSEIKQLADQIVVLRDGRIVFEQRRPFDLAEAINAMLNNAGRQELEKSEAQRSGLDTAIKLHNLRVLEGERYLHSEFRYGEVTGIVGLIGAGKTELAEAIFGARQPLEGRIFRGATKRDHTSISTSIKEKLYLVPEDRAQQAMFPDWSIKDTATLPFLKKLSSGGIVNLVRERGFAKKIISTLKVVCTDEDQEVDALSGGNQQKVVVGRWLLERPDIFLLDEPFRGVDIGARWEISQQLKDAAREGACVVVFSSDIDEIIDVADRVIVLVEGGISLDKYVDEVTFDEIVATMSEVG